jgi:CRP/FNR family transcriptional regulator, cyclic AMP receptor protein
VRTYRAMRRDLPMREVKRRLSWVDFLAPLSEEELDSLVVRASFARFEEGDVLVVGPEEHAERMLLTVSGQLQVYEKALVSGRELTLSVLASGSPVGSTGLVARWTRDLYIRALEPSVVCRIERLDLEALVERNPEAGLRLARMLAAQLMLMEDRWADMAEKEVSARLAGLLYMLAESEGVMSKEGPLIPTRYTHQQLASMIGSQREAVTRAFSVLQEGGCVKVRRRNIYVKDFDALRRAAGE